MRGAAPNESKMVIADVDDPSKQHVQRRWTGSVMCRQSDDPHGERRPAGVEVDDRNTLAAGGAGM